MRASIYWVWVAGCSKQRYAVSVSERACALSMNEWSAWNGIPKVQSKLWASPKTINTLCCHIITEEKFPYKTIKKMDFHINFPWMRQNACGERMGADVNVATLCFGNGAVRRQRWWWIENASNKLRRSDTRHVLRVRSPLAHIFHAPCSNRSSLNNQILGFFRAPSTPAKHFATSWFGWITRASMCVCLCYVNQYRRARALFTHTLLHSNV